MMVEASQTPVAKAEEEKIQEAGQIVCKACEDSGLKVSSWEDFPAWKEFVAGEITEEELVERARRELNDTSRVFGKYLVMDREDPAIREKEVRKRELAKQANRIYRELCDAEGLTMCFFKDFGAWGDFVGGHISEAEFLERVRDEANRISVGK